MSSFFKIKDFSILKLGILSFLLTNSPESIAQYDDKADIIIIHEDSIKRFRFNVLPLLFYTPETEVGFGLGGQSTFFTKGSSVYTRPSSAIVTAIYTSRSQVILSFLPEIYFRNEAYYLEGVMQYKIFPNKFWGLGNRTPSSNEEEYNMVTTWIMAKLLKRLPGEVGFGFTIEVQNFVVIEKVEGGLLDSGVEGADDAVSSMFKVNFDVDTRDNTMNPFRGQFITLVSGFASKAIWSTNSFNSIELDARKYINMGDNGVLAARFHIVNTNGDPPFQKMSWFGGGDENRGYFKGRYIDFSFSG